jgi:hypothetical protein
MNKHIALAASLWLSCIGAAQAQATGCTCDDAASRTASFTALTTLLSNRMVCATLGSEAWQEWHNGTSSGLLVDYKRGPSDATDPSATVGTYVVNADNTVTYNYSGGPSYTYDVCLVASSNTYTFCGASHGGRNITGARIGGPGPISCSAVSNVVPRALAPARVGTP